MLLVSTGFKIAILGPQSFAQIFDGGQLRLFSGSRPGAADMGEPSQPIGIVQRVGATTPGLQFVQTGPYIINPPSDDWLLTTLQPGTPTWFRLVAAGDTYGDSPTAARIDGDIGSAAAPSDMTLDVTTFTPNTTLPFASFLYTIPPVIGA